MDVHSASRLGSPPEADSSYARPIVVKFNKLPTGTGSGGSVMTISTIAKVQQ